MECPYLGSVFGVSRTNLVRSSQNGLRMCSLFNNGSSLLRVSPLKGWQKSILLGRLLDQHAACILSISCACVSSLDVFIKNSWYAVIRYGRPSSRNFIKAWSQGPCGIVRMCEVSNWLILQKSGWHWETYIYTAVDSWELRNRQQKDWGSGKERGEEEIKDDAGMELWARVNLGSSIERKAIKAGLEEANSAVRAHPGSDAGKGMSRGTRGSSALSRDQ